MASLTIKCDNCGAPLEYDGGENYHIRCPYCNNTVIVPEDMRPAKSEPQPVRIDASAVIRNPAVKKSISSGMRILIIVLISFFVLGMIALVGGSIFLANVTDQAISGVENTPIDIVGVEELMPVLTPEPTPTPAFAVPQARFGQEGMNPGQFDDARNIATDGHDTIFVADYLGGRVQAFDMQGKFLRQWQTGDSDASIQGLAADRSGRFYVAQGGVIYQFDVTLDDPVNQFSYAGGGDFGDLTVTPQDELVAIWYEARWGIITELEGHREAVVFFDEQGGVLNVLESPISGRSGDLVLDASMVVDGKNNIYLLEYSNLYIYTPEGEYRNVVTLYTPESDLSSFSSELCIDGQGQLYLAESLQVHVFDPAGRYLTAFPVDLSVRSMAVDDQDRIWVLSTEQVVEYVRYVSGQ